MEILSLTVLVEGKFGWKSLEEVPGGNEGSREEEGLSQLGR